MGKCQSALSTFAFRQSSFQLASFPRIFQKNISHDPSPLSPDCPATVNPALCAAYLNTSMPLTHHYSYLYSSLPQPPFLKLLTQDLFNLTNNLYSPLNSFIQYPNLFLVMCFPVTNCHFSVSLDYQRSSVCFFPAPLIVIFTVNKAFHYSLCLSWSAQHL